jgi:hypothetical protein
MCGLSILAMICATSPTPMATNTYSVVYVSPGGVDDVSCGASVSSPCATVRVRACRLVGVAGEEGRRRDRVRVFQVENGREGGWRREGASWRRGSAHVTVH